MAAGSSGGHFFGTMPETTLTRSQLACDSAEADRDLGDDAVDGEGWRNKS